MLNFKKIEIEDRDWVNEILSRSERVSLEYNFTTMFIWGDIYNTEIAERDGVLLCSSGEDDKQFLFPIGEDFAGVLRELDEYTNGRMSFYALTKTQCEILEKIYPGRFSFREDRDSEDYIYKTETLTELRGKKLSAKRNHINRFFMDYPDWKYEKITEKNISEAAEMSEKWFAENEKSEALMQEKQAVAYAFKYFDELHLTGGLLKVGNEAAAFSIGDELNKNTFLVHIEKALSEFKGAYSVINNLFATNACAGYKLVNREEDTGDEGLRKAKLSYQPFRLAEKYSAVSK